MQGIYTITHIASGKCYVGSSVQIPKRWREHRRLLAAAKHHSPALQRAWQKHGPTGFTFAIIETVVSADDLFPREQFYLETLAPAYNSAPYAGGGQRGRKASAATRQKMSESHTGKSQTPESIAKALATKAANGHHKYTPEGRAALSEQRVGRKWSAVQRAALDGHRDKLSQAAIRAHQALTPEERSLRAGQLSRAGWAKRKAQADIAAVQARIEANKASKAAGEGNGEGGDAGVTA